MIFLQHNSRYVIVLFLGEKSIKSRRKKKMKSFLKATLTLLVLLFVCVLTFTACDEKDHEHAWGEWNTVENASCTKEGKQERSCSCGEKESQSIPMVSHTVVLDAAVSATCGNTGLTEGSHCSVCGEIIVAQQTIEKVDHSFDLENIVWTWNGYESVTATLTCVNDNTHTRQINANVTDEVTTAPTCTATGTKTYTATVKIDGVTYTATKNETIAALGHTEITDAAIVATCEQTGLTEGSHCSVCNEVLVAQQEVPATGHHYDTGNIAWTWEKYDIGDESVYVTLTCKENATHTKKMWVHLSSEITAPSTCSAEGVKTHTAYFELDGVKYSQQKTESIEKAAHTWGHGTVTTPATPEVEGEKTYTCVDCPAVYRETFAYPITQNEWNQAIDNIIGSQNITMNITGEGEGWSGFNATYSIDGTKLYIISIAGDIYEVFYSRENDKDYFYNLTDGIWEKSELGGVMDYSISVCLPWNVWEQFKNSYSSFVYDDNTGFYEAPDLTVVFKLGEEEITISAITFVISDGVITGLNYTFTYDDGTIEIMKTTFKDIGSTTVVIPHIHEWSEWFIETEATCTDNGLKKRECTCGEEETGIIYAEGHNYESIVTAPTCEEQGYTTYTCSACVSSYIGLYTDALGHSWGEWEVKETNTVRYCDNDCGDYQRITSISASYHGIRLLTGESVWVDDVTVVATLSDNSIISIDDFTLENDVMTVDGANYVTVKFKTLSTTFSVPAIYNNLPGTTSTSEFTYTEEDDAITITGFIGSSTDIIIPAHINRVPVRYIGESAFNGQENIKSVVIPDSIYSVAKEAFYNCKRIASVSFGKGLTTIGHHAFYNCISLTELTIPVNVITIDGTWGDGAFENCTGLKKVTIGDATVDIAATTIGERAFANCTALTEVFIGNQVKLIDAEAFSGCSALTTVTIGTGVQSIGDAAFYNCEALTTVVVPDSVITIGAEAFYNCKRIAS
ncbi:MAG: leucine-rich repeat domain-containing protein, partial [Clostridia bacterium]|nr:leucine-rich repeat domain-containing protein [Clostridia bacterium]